VGGDVASQALDDDQPDATAATAANAAPPSRSSAEAAVAVAAANNDNNNPAANANATPAFSRQATPPRGLSRWSRRPSLADQAEESGRRASVERLVATGAAPPPLPPLPTATTAAPAATAAAAILSLPPILSGRVAGGVGLESDGSVHLTVLRGRVTADEAPRLPAAAATAKAAAKEGDDGDGPFSSAAAAAPPPAAASSSAVQQQHQKHHPNSHNNKSTLAARLRLLRLKWQQWRAPTPLRRLGAAARRAARLACGHPDFEAAVLLLIAANCVTLALYRPTDGPRSPWNAGLGRADAALNFCFTAEVAIRAAAAGGPWRYLRASPWNAFDALMVALGYTALVDLGGGGGGGGGEAGGAEAAAASSSSSSSADGLRALRALRALRPLRAITRFDSLRSVVACFLEAVPLLLSVGAIMAFFLFVFGVAGTELFRGAMRRACAAPPDPQLVAALAAAAASAAEGGFNSLLPAGLSAYASKLAALDRALRVYPPDFEAEPSLAAAVAHLPMPPLGGAAAAAGAGSTAAAIAQAALERATAAALAVAAVAPDPRAAAAALGVVAEVGWTDADEFGCPQRRCPALPAPLPLAALGSSPSPLPLGAAAASLAASEAGTGVTMYLPAASYYYRPLLEALAGGGGGGGGAGDETAAALLPPPPPPPTLRAACALFPYPTNLNVAGFDNAAWSMLTVFQSMTLSGWTGVMYRCVRIFLWMLGEQALSLAPDDETNRRERAPRPANKKPNKKNPTKTQQKTQQKTQNKSQQDHGLGRRLGGRLLRPPRRIWGLLRAQPLPRRLESQVCARTVAARGGARRVAGGAPRGRAPARGRAAARSRRGEGGRARRARARGRVAGPASS
jgi:hypothetical protein